MKRLACLLALTLLLAACDNGKSEMFPDPAFAKCVQDRIDYAVSIGLWQKDDPDIYNKVDELECYGGGISNIKGIENMPNINWLAVVDNQLVSLEPLRTLTKLTFLKLDNNKIKDLRPLSGLSALATLSLSDNYIEDISPLYSLTKLVTVLLDGNCIANASQFQELKKHSPDVQTGGAENYQDPSKCK